MPSFGSGEKEAFESEEDKREDHKPVGDMSAALIPPALVGGASLEPCERTLPHIMDMGKQAYQRFGWAAKVRQKKSKVEEPLQNNTGGDKSSGESDDDSNGDTDGDWWLGY